MKNVYLSVTIFVSVWLAGCSGMTIVDQAGADKPAAATREQTIDGANNPKDAKDLDYGIRFRIYLDAANPAKNKQYFKLHVDNGTSIEQRLRVNNLNPHQGEFIGRCTPFERNTTVYTLSNLKLGGAWKFAEPEQSQERKYDVFANGEIIFEIAAQAGVGYLEIDLEKYY